VLPMSQAAQCGYFHFFRLTAGELLFRLLQGIQSAQNTDDNRVTDRRNLHHWRHGVRISWTLWPKREVALIYVSLAF